LLSIKAGVDHYADGCLAIGTDSGIDDSINNLKDYEFGLEFEQNLTNYLSCRVDLKMRLKIISGTILI
jgi:hypothetical protein